MAEVKRYLERCNQQRQWWYLVCPKQAFGVKDIFLAVSYLVLNFVSFLVDNVVDNPCMTFGDWEG